MRKVSQYYVPVYKKLIHIKEYSRLFDTKAIGGMYRLIESRVWRLERDETRANGFFSTDILRLAEMYENGHLAAVISDKDLSEWLGVSSRHIRRMRNQLVELGILQTHKPTHKSDTYYYIVGERLKSDTYGYHSEVTYIQKWVKEVDEFWSSGGTETQELSFVQDLVRVLSSKTDKAGFSTEDSGHTCPGIWTYMSTIFTKNDPEIPVQNGETEVEAVPYNNNDLNKIKIINNSEQPELNFNGLIPQFDLTSVNLQLTPIKLVRAIRQARESVGDEKLKSHLLSEAKKAQLKMDSGYRDRLFYSNLFDQVMKKLGADGYMTSTLIFCWWQLLALDLGRDEFLKNPAKSKIILSKAKKLNHWGEFSYLLNNFILNSPRGYHKLRELEHVSWLVKWLNSLHWRLEDYRSQYVHVSDMDVMKDKARMQREREEYKKQIEAMMEDVAEEDVAEEDDFDLDDLLGVG